MLEPILFVLYTLLLVIFVLVALRLRYAYTHFKMKSLVTGPMMIEKLPSVTVCIPARNEMHAVTDSLQRAIASTYPKLEIIVLDDMSGDNTSTLIKAFAHEGVRFVEGTGLPEGWLGKNHALQGLVKEASGTYILFMDVDTRIEPHTIEQLVAYVEQEKALMVSVLPRRDDGPRASVLFSTLRYFWEIIFHRTSSPATASSAWMIHRQTLLDKWQGFAGLKDAIQPESRISAALMASGQYRFLIGTALLGISHEKKWRSQLITSTRLLFPLLGARTMRSLVAMVDLLIVATPLFVVLAGFFFGWSVHQLIAGIFVILLGGLYGSYLRKVWRRGWLVGMLLWPLIVIQEAILVVVSAIAYGRRSVTWKGRLVQSPKR